MQVLRGRNFFCAFTAVQAYVMLCNATRKRRPGGGYSSAISCAYVRQAPVVAARASPLLTGRPTPQLSTGKFSFVQCFVTVKNCPVHAQ